MDPQAVTKEERGLCDVTGGFARGGAGILTKSIMDVFVSGVKLSQPLVAMSGTAGSVTSMWLQVPVNK